MLMGGVVTVEVTQSFKEDVGTASEALAVFIEKIDIEALESAREAFEKIVNSAISKGFVSSLKNLDLVAAESSAANSTRL